MAEVQGGSADACAAPHPPDASPHRKVHENTAALAIGALGVVYGDIGTSPLYTVRECFNGPHAVAINPTNLLGVASLIFWSFIIVVSVKYVGFVLKADNRGEGGIFALLGLILGSPNPMSPKLRSAIMIGAIFGASLLYGEGIITPSISVLSAIEGLEVATEAAKPFVVPLTCIVLVALFSVQRRGTSGVGRIFGPVMVVWFLTIAGTGTGAILRAPQILLSINPWYAWSFFSANQLHGFVVLGSVVLCITGCEALYADLGHFGSRAIRVTWLGLALPSLLLNYFGQCALLLDRPDASFHPFYALVPSPALYPMVALSTIAAVIASQALISGAFSLTQQAVQLGICPRVHIVHTSAKVKGQIYIPSINYALMIACLVLVVTFKESSRLAGAYGMAVTATMNLTSILFFIAALHVWRWPLWKAALPVALFLCFDVSYFGANLFKFFDGGWIALVVAILVATVFTTWRKGPRRIAEAALFRPDPPGRVPGGPRPAPDRARARDGGVHDAFHRRHTAHPAPPRQAQPHAARPRGAADDTGGRRSGGGRRGPAAHRAAVVRVLSAGGLVRVHGNTERAESPETGGLLRPAPGTHENDVLPRPGNASDQRHFPHGSVAQGRFRLHVAQRGQPGRLFRHPSQPGR